MSDAPKNLSDRDIFHEFCRRSAENMDRVLELTKMIANERERLGLRPIKRFDDPKNHEQLAKGLALIDMNLSDGKVPNVLIPWITAHRINSVFALLQGCGGLTISYKDRESSVSKICLDIVERYMPLSEFISENGFDNEIG